MDTKPSKLIYGSLIAKILTVLIIPNVAGDVLSAYWFISTPSLGELSLYGGLIASFAGKNGAIMIASALLLT